MIGNVHDNGTSMFICCMGPDRFLFHLEHVAARAGYSNPKHTIGREAWRSSHPVAVVDAFSMDFPITFHEKMLGRRDPPPEYG